MTLFSRARHTAITHLVQAGIDLPTVKRISDHKTLQMVEHYSHQNGSHIQAAMDKLQNRYMQSTRIGTKNQILNAFPSCTVTIQPYSHRL